MKQCLNTIDKLRSQPQNWGKCLSATLVFVLIFLFFTVVKENLNVEMRKLANFIVQGEIQQCHFVTAQKVIDTFEELKKEAFRTFAGV